MYVNECPWNNLMHEMWQLLQGKIALSLDVLTAMAEELDALQPIRRRAIMPVFIQMSQLVFSLLGHFITGKHSKLLKTGCPQPCTSGGTYSTLT